MGYHSLSLSTSDRLTRREKKHYGKHYFFQVFLSKPTTWKSYTAVLLNTTNIKRTLESADWCSWQQSFLTGLSKITCFKTQVWDGLHIHLTASHVSWWQLGVPDQLTGEIWVLFLAEQTKPLRPCQCMRIQALHKLEGETWHAFLFTDKSL